MRDKLLASSTWGQAGVPLYFDHRLAMSLRHETNEIPNNQLRISSPNEPCETASGSYVARRVARLFI